MKDLFVVHESLISADTIAEITFEANKLPVVPGKIGAGNQEQPSFRSSSLRWIERNNEPFGDLFTTFEQLFHKANRASFGFDLSFLPSIQYTEYPASANGHYDWHVDVFWQTPSFYQRKLSLVVQLSDPSEYEGGVFEMDEHIRPDPVALSKKGSVLIFPSFIKHRVTPVTKGVRRSLVGWIEGPTWR